MKIFLDTVDVARIQEMAHFIDGLTTNPSLFAFNKITNPRERIQEILTIIPNKDVSIQVTELEPQAMYKQALKIARLGSHVVVKIPYHIEYFPIIGRLAAEGIRINITLISTLFQAITMCKLGATYISPFVGRLDDHDINGSELLFQLRSVIDQYNYTTQILAASIRTVQHVHNALLAGADAITMPLSIFRLAVTHPITDQGLVAFNEDWQKLAIDTFP